MQKKHWAKSNTFHDKNSQQIRNRGELPQPDLKKKSTKNIQLKSGLMEELKAFPLRTRKRQGCQTLTIPFLHHSGHTNQYKNKKRKYIRMGRKKTVFVHR